VSETTRPDLAQSDTPYGDMATSLTVAVPARLKVAVHELALSERVSDSAVVRRALVQLLASAGTEVAS